MHSKNKNTNLVGLVLSGGGAKGAYHVGVMKALKEFEIPINMISGASIGALNGAVLASAPTLDIGIERLQKLWQTLPYTNPIKFQPKISSNSIFNKIPDTGFKKIIYFSLLISAGLRFSSPIGALATILGKTLISSTDLERLFSDDVLVQMMEKYLDLDTLQKSIPLYVSVFPQNKDNKAFSDFIFGLKDAAKLSLLGVDNKHSEFKHIQSLDLESQKEFILASAALPLLFKAYKEESGNRFTDGGQGGMIKSQGNTPITPLIEAGCRNIIVVHLSEGSLWHRHDFSNAKIIEIRPSIPMGSYKEMLDFSESAIQNLIQTGYKDAERSLQRVQTSLSSISSLRESTHNINNALSDTSTIEQLEKSMNRLKSLKNN